MANRGRFARGDGRPRGRGGGRKKASAVPAVPVPPQQPSLAEVLAQIGAHGGDPRISVELQETFACLPIKRQRLLLNFVASGQIAESARHAGYNCTTARSASEVGRQVLADPRVQFCLRAIQGAEHGNGAALATILAHHMAGFQGSEADRNRSAKIALSVYRQTRPVPVPGTKPLADQLLDEMSERELETFITEKRWPERFRDRLAPSMCATLDVVHHHGRTEPELTRQDATAAVNSHARHREPRDAGEPIDPADVAPSRPAPAASPSRAPSCGDYVAAPSPPTVRGERVYDPTSTPSTTPAGPVNAHLAADAELERQQIVQADETLRALRRHAADPLLRDLANSDRRW